MSKNPWVWFDVDDVLVDTSFQLEKSLRKFTGLDRPVAAWPNHMFTEIYGIPAEHRDLMRQAWVDDQVLETAELFDGVKEALELVATKGYRIGLITARAWHPNALNITEGMARDFGLPAERVILLNFVDSKHGLLEASGTEIAGFIDDTPRHVQGALDRGWLGRLATRSWNLGSEIPRVDSALHFAQDLQPADAALISRRSARP